MIISAFYSGLRGGKMFADGLCQGHTWRTHSHTMHLPLGALLTGCTVCGTGLCSLLTEKGIMQKLPFVKKPFDPNES